MNKIQAAEAAQAPFKYLVRHMKGMINIPPECHRLGRMTEMIRSPKRPRQYLPDINDSQFLSLQKNSVREQIELLMKESEEARRKFLEEVGLATE